MGSWHELSLSELEAQARGGDTWAMRRLSDAYQDGLRGAPVDVERAVGWARHAAESGSARAALRMGDRCNHGVGVPHDVAHAAAWWRMAAERGLMEAQANLASYLRSDGATRAEGDQWLRAAAAQGQPWAKHTIETGDERSHQEKMVAFAAMSLEEMAAAAGDDVDTMEASFRAKGSLAALGGSLAAWISELAHGDPDVEARATMDGERVDFPGVTPIEPDAVESDSIELEIELRWFGTIAVTVGHDDGAWELAVSGSEPRPSAEQARGALARLEGHLRAHMKKVAREE